jgi:DNA-directed RNA polymerase subunit N (RpoN/RPB10)
MEKKCINKGNFLGFRKTILAILSNDEKAICIICGKEIGHDNFCWLIDNKKFNCFDCGRKINRGIHPYLPIGDFKDAEIVKIKVEY